MLKLAFILASLLFGSLAQQQCMDYPKPRGSFFNSTAIISTEFILGNTLTWHVYGCETLCRSKSGCLALMYNITSNNCTIYKSMNVINSIINCSNTMVLFPLVPEECRDIIQAKNEGWTIMQRRIDGSVDFYLDWYSYKHGFGEICHEFWLGLETVHLLIKDHNTTLRFDLWDGDIHRHMEYYSTTIANEAENYRLDYNGMSGNAGDSMTNYSKGIMFSTKDRDNDLYHQHCAVVYTGAWWHRGCHNSNLNGQYGMTEGAKGIHWKTFTGFTRSLSKTEMKIKISD